MNDAVDTAIVGAGPYGLSIAAHMRGAGVDFREFGVVMHPWQTAMPRGMFLKSQGFASNLSDPAGAHTLAEFCRTSGRPYADYGLPVPLDTFVAYGRWFASAVVPEVEESLLTGLTTDGDGYELALTTGEAVRARRVVVATGVEHFAHVPPALAVLPTWACTHSSAHCDLSVFAGRRVAVVGAGQSALESAALLHESGATVQLVMRERAVVWNGPPLPPDRPLRQRLREPEAGLGSGWTTWFYSRRPGMFRRLPGATRVRRARTALGPAGAAWLRARVEGRISVLAGQNVRQAQAADGQVRLMLAGRDGVGAEIVVDHVIAATGYRTDLSRLEFLDSRLRAAIDLVGGAPAVGPDYQSSAPGLYFAGPCVAPTFGPVMRFVYGADHAARTIAPALAATRAHRLAQPAGVSR